jgi:prepilin-type processing-associated H-X9-DG protein
VTDGTSKTIVFSELRTLEDVQDERGAWALAWNAASQISADVHHNDGLANSHFTEFWPHLGYVYQAQLPNTLGPNADTLVRCAPETLAQAQLEQMPCIPHIDELGLGGYISAAPRSNHTGGVNTAFLDGHVEFLLNDVDPGALSLMVAIRDSEVIRDVAREAGK